MTKNFGRLAPVLFAFAILASACGAVLGSSDDAASSATTVPIAPTTLSSAEPAATETTAAAAVEEEVAETEPAEEERTGPLLDEDGEPITVLHPELRPVLAPEPMSAGPIQFTPVVCEITGVDTFGFDSRVDLAAAGDRLFYSGAHGVAALAPNADSTAGGPCSLSVDESMGPGGIMNDDPGYYRLSGNTEGRLIAANLPGSFVYDTHLNQSFECGDMSGNVALSSDGTTGYAYWVGEEIETFELTDSICTAGEVVTYDGFDSTSRVTSVGDSLYVSGRNLDGTNTLKNIQGGAAVWTLGSDEPGELDWWASVEGVAPCGDNVCVVEWFGSFNVIDPAGTIVAQFDVDSAVGAWNVSRLVRTADGTLYLLAGESEEHEFDGSTHFNWIVRLD